MQVKIVQLTHLFILFFSAIGFSQESLNSHSSQIANVLDEGVVSRFGLKGNIRVRGRTEDPEAKDRTNWVDLRILADGYVNLTADGCLQLRARISTGDRYNTDSSQTGLGDKPENIKIYLRHLYVDYTCYLNKVAIQAGAMPVKTQSLSGAYYNGWVDGIRIGYQRTSNSEIVATVGSLNDLNKPSVFDRSYDDLNYLQVFVKQDISKVLNAFVDMTHLDKNTYVNFTMDMILKDYFSFLSALKIDVGTINGKYQSAVVELSKVVGQWKLALGYSDKDSFNGSEDTKVRLPTDPFYSEGHFVYFVINRKINNSWSVNFRFKNEKKLKAAELSVQYLYN